jgi:hypothetical protein
MNAGVLILFVIMPTVLSIAAVVSSLIVSCRARHALHFLISALVVAGVAWSLVILYRIFVQGAWPSYLPYFVIGFLVAVVIAQILWFSWEET